MKKVTTGELAAALNISRQSISKRAKKQQWKPTGDCIQGGGNVYDLNLLPLSKDELYKVTRYLAALMLQAVAQNAGVEENQTNSPEKEHPSWRYFEARPQKKKDEAAARLKALDAVDYLIKTGSGACAAVNMVAKQFNKAPSSIRGWRLAVKGADRCDWLALLVPRHEGRQQEKEFTEEAWKYFKSDFLRLERPAAAACYERLKRVATEKKWELPSLKTLQRKIEKEIPRALLILAREGKEALKRSFPAQERDHAVYRALEAVTADGHKFDVFVQFPDGEIGRPMMVAWQDIYSAKVLSYRVDKTENSDLVRLSFGDLAGKYGIPKQAYLDNGRGFASKWITGGMKTRFRFKIKEEEPAGVLTQLGVDVHWATPYHGQAKPIERTFRDLCEYVSKHPALAGAYTGNSPSRKPENYGSKAIPLADFLKILDHEIKAHNEREGRRSKVCSGQSFEAIFNESYAAGPVRKATREQLRVCLLAAEKVHSSKQDGSITLLGNRYYSERLAPYAGKLFTVRFDPQNLHGGIYVYHYTGEYVGPAECIQPSGFGDTEAAREHAKKRNQYMKTTKKQLDLERSMTAIEAASMIPQDETEALTPATKVSEMMFVQNQRQLERKSERQEKEEFEHYERGLLASLEKKKKEQASLL